MDKAAIRRSHRARRRTRPSRLDGSALASVLRDLLAAYGLGPGLTLAGYLPATGEPDTRPSLTDAWAHGCRVFVPRTLGGCRMEWVAWSPDTALGPDRHGLTAPHGVGVADALRAPATVMLIPALAVDRRGSRLGQGAGYYDRDLAALPRWPTGPLRVAVVHPDEVLDEDLPADPHDEPVDAVLTADGWFPATTA